MNKVENVEKEAEEALSVQPEEEAEKVMSEECAIKIPDAYADS